MNNILSNNRLLPLLTAMGIFIMNGCVSQNGFQKNSFIQPSNVANKSKPWKKIEQDRDSCPDCYASDISLKKSVALSSSTQKEYMTYDYSNAPTDLESSYVEYKDNYTDKVIDTQHYGAYDYSVTADDRYVEVEDTIKVAPKPSYVNSSMDSFNTKLTSNTTIQVGAFRHYSGAKKVAKKYSLLSSPYSVQIKTGMKDNAPIHRVQITGFHSKGQAKAFMQRYALYDAFLVRR